MVGKALPYAIIFLIVGLIFARNVEAASTIYRYQLNKAFVISYTAAFLFLVRCRKIYAMSIQESHYPISDDDILQ